MVSLSAITPPNSSADQVAAARCVTTCADLLHIVRRFSMTATVLEQEVAVVIQRDIAPVECGEFVVQPVAQDAHPGNDQLTHAMRRRLTTLGRDVGRVFRGTHTITWATDIADRLWIIDIGPEHVPETTRRL